VDIGVIVEGEELVELDNDEHVVRIVDFLKERLAPSTWPQHGNKLKNIFAMELKKRKTEQYQAEGTPFFIARSQGEFRIIYTESDQELMVTVFNKCKRRFNGIVTRDEALLKSRRMQRRIEDYFTALADGHADASGGQFGAGSDALSADVAETRPRSAPYTKALKRAKLGESRAEGLSPPVAFNHGEYRILYTEADHELMVQTLADCRPRFEAIAGRDAPLSSRPHCGQRSIMEFMRAAGDAQTDGDAEGVSARAL